MKCTDCVEEESEDEGEEKKQKVKDECEEREAEEQRRGVGEVESRGEQVPETEEEGEQKRTASPSHRANSSRDQKSLPYRPRTSSSCTGSSVRPVPVRSG